MKKGCPICHCPTFVVGGRPIQEYETIRPMYEFLVMPKNGKKHWSDSSGWIMAKFMHQEVMKAIRTVVGGAQYVVISCDDFL